MFTKDVGSEYPYAAIDARVVKKRYSQWLRQLSSLTPKVKHHTQSNPGKKQDTDTRGTRRVKWHSAVLSLAKSISFCIDSTIQK